MREILFRGKTDNKWVYGVPIYLRKEAYIVRDFCLGGDYTDDWVEAKTVGQYTGLTDKNGNKIFEGDIVISPHGTMGYVEWLDEECAYFVNIGDDWQEMNYCEYEVIGNIHDNKELLGE